MKAPIEWLKQYIRIDMPPEKLADKLTMGGVEVGAIEYHGNNLSDVVVGKIKNIETHSKKADVLIVQVDTGFKILQIVTKAQNVKVGDKVPVAVHGAILPSGMKIESREMHGVESFGMLCSTVELGLTGSTNGIMILDKESAVGEDIKKILGLGGAVLDVDVLPNRIDLLSIIGIAREIGAVLGRKIKEPNFKVKESTDKASAKIKISVKDPELCPRYTSRIIKGIKVAPSPKWIEERLSACGIRSINNIVDVTNFVLLEMGQPLHAFDLNLLKGSEINVRRSKKDEKIKTLDGEVRHLNGDLVIADKENAIALAGVMGGLTSEVTDSTVDILLESAYFDPKTIHKTEKRLKVRTEASARFDRGIDWDSVVPALDRAAALIAELGGGVVLKGIIDVCSKPRKPKKIKLSPERVEQILGRKIKAQEIKTILERLGIKYSSGVAEVPCYRAGDIEREIDIIEEIARIYGYENIPATLPTLKLSPSDTLKDEQMTGLKHMLCDMGLNETINYSMLPSNDKGQFSLTNSKRITLLNPITDDLAVMRTSLIPSLLKVLSYNTNRQIEDVNIYEIGKTFSRNDKGDVVENVMLGALLYGKRSYRLDGGKDEPDLSQLKMIVKEVLEYLGVTFTLSLCEMSSFNKFNSATIVFEGQTLGAFGQIHPSVLSGLGIIKDTYAVIINLHSLLGVKKLPKRYKEIPVTPASRRDIALVVPNGTSHKAIIDLIKASGGAIVEEVRLFDMYKGGQIEKGFYSLAYSITYRDPLKTLTDEDISKVHNSITENLSQKLSVKVRK